MTLFVGDENHAFVTADGSDVVEVVNDFESQDGQAVNGNWGSEVEVRKEGFSTIDAYETASPIDGSASRSLGGDGGGTTYKHVRTSSEQFTSFSGKLRLEQDDGENSDEVRISLRDGSTLLIRFELQCDGPIQVNNSNTGASWSSTPTANYLFEATNIDWSANTFDWTVTNDDTGTEVASDTGESFVNPATNADTVYFGGDNGGQAGIVEGIYDTLEVTLP